MKVLFHCCLVLLLVLPIQVHSADQPTHGLRVMSLNIYGWATMPDQAHLFAKLVNSLDIDVLGIQEGVDDWQIQGMPTDYSRSETMAKALGDCWSHKYQVFYRHCNGVTLLQSKRFDLSDGPNAVRTGELARIAKNGNEFVFINIHWDHESAEARRSSAVETAQVVNNNQDKPVIVLGDFNSPCAEQVVTSMANLTGMQLVVDGGIDCVFSSSLEGSGNTVDAAPSDHPGVVAEFGLRGN